VPLLVLLCASGTAVAQDAPDGSTITLNGTLTQVRWSDGDSFRVLDGEHEGRSTRLTGYNSLESYGPVHRWGEFTGAELYEVAGLATVAARAERWSCTSAEEPDHYGRLLVTCGDLILAMVASGYGHLMLLDDTATPEQIAAQAGAREAGLGMWSKGVPAAIVTSLHSAAEGGGRIYNRVISTTDGRSTQVDHTDVYEVCQEVCLEGSCLTYVPYEQRYSNQPDCLTP
jgi:endonuclease YncB( thermonuclease family)